MTFSVLHPLISESWSGVWSFTYPGNAKKLFVQYLFIYFQFELKSPPPYILSRNLIINVGVGVSQTDFILSFLTLLS